MPEKNHAVVTGFVIGIIILLIAASFIVILVAYSSRRKNRFLQEQQQMQLLFTEQLLQSRLETQEQTLRHLSTELHDNLGALASLIKINLLTIPVTDPVKSAQKIADTADLTRQMIADLKALSVSLNSDHIGRKGLVASVAVEVERINKTEQFTATLKVDGNIPAFENDKSVILFRMVQEILNNMVKHSAAKNILVDISCRENALSMILSDDGVGFDLRQQLENGNGAGLHNLQKRAAMISAALVTQSHPGHGTRVSINIPLD